MSVLAIAEHRRGELRPVSLEQLAAGRDLADQLGGELHTAVIGGDVEAFGADLNREGVDAVHTVDIGEEFNHDVYTQVVTQLATELDPTVLLMPNSVNGLDYAPAVANRLDRPLVTDVVDIDAEDGLTATRELYGSKAETTIDVHAEQAAVTIRPAEWPTIETDGDAAIEAFDATLDESAVRSTVKGFEEVGGGDIDITDADVLVSVGRGIEEEENLDIIHDLAEALDATVSGSRPLIDNGWLEKDRQVGQSGKVVTPDVYIAIGISGAVQHVAGMKGSDTIVAINTDPNAPIFDIADYGIQDDLFEVVPALTEQFQ
ncbi:electron transfer flavoprotein subunit alpha/FixB family protein [Haloarcula sp. CBA1130]|uniref:electron transfer flavoprotein subunit alpha/FixB family protein n=1 Tax=unclassified Haloarcula TaxID=2624677 RepID=UPI00124524D7|nr:MULTISPECIES: electron transfer flavoprotein subunit alpha/FixB family protein [unclassified Haloarcula]KAA9399075.1 electron transfer flavoprotein subunit alpha/FixB family protein [Haloarcula sp. CBA1129]KAA9403589.1 electron transfer flavoprotein subunit alpha/FixB family protein [Haloarcula sp. CBA1130]